MKLFLGSIELGRILIKFPITELSGKIFTDQTIPSASVTYKLKMFNMQHAETVPTSFDLHAFPLTRDWDEGTGTALPNLDYGFSNWISASSTQTWTSAGSDFNATMSGCQHFDRGLEDFEVDVTQIVNEWLTGSTISSNGFVIKFGPTEESNTNSYYLKAFHGRESKFIERLPYLEARWDSAGLKDNRKNFAYNQQNKLFMYNFIRGELVNVSNPVYVRIQDAAEGAFARFSQTLTASSNEVGIYSASFTIVNTASFSGTFYDIWHSGAVVYMTGNFRPLWLTGSQSDQYSEFTLNVDNLKQTFTSQEEYRFRVTARKRDYKTHFGVIKSASLDMDREYIEKLYYSIINNETGEVIVPFGTGTVPYTQCGYDTNGNFFNLYMNSFVPGFVYRMLFLIDINKYDKKVVDNNFLFKIV